MRHVWRSVVIAGAGLLLAGLSVAGVSVAGGAVGAGRASTHDAPHGSSSATQPVTTTPSVVGIPPATDHLRWRLEPRRTFNCKLRNCSLVTLLTAP
jgi:hypothetical protein